MTITFPTPAPRSWKNAIWHGLTKSCPNCGKGRLFSGYLTVENQCSSCGQELHHQRADDAPPYFTVFIVGHIVVPMLLVVERVWQPPLWVHFSTWLPLTLFLSLWLLPRCKGATIGLQWALGMHGFGGVNRTDVPDSTAVGP